MTQVRRLPEAKKPLVTPLPEGRFRYTRYLTAETAQTMLADKFPEFQEADLAAPADYENLHLIDRGYEIERGSNNCIIIVVFETLTDTFAKEKADVVDYEMNGLRRVTRELIALPDTEEALVISESTFEQDGFPTLYLAGKKLTRADGAARLVLTYLEPGELNTTVEYKNNGALQIQGNTWFHSAPPTPSGFTLVSTQNSDVSGYPTFTYSFARGSGLISREVEQKYNGALVLTTDTILTAMDGPESAPDALVVEFSREFRESDGYRIWTLRGAAGSGVISTSHEESYNGALHTTTIRALNVYPATPSGYVLVSDNVTEGDGYHINEVTFAKGDGQISYDLGTSSNGALLRISIRHITGPTGSNPITTPGGYTLIEGPSFQEASGHRIWSAAFAKGNGQVSYSPGTSHNGALLRIAIRHLTAPGAGNPITTPGGYTLVDGPSFEQADGHLMWSASFVKGLGEISREVEEGPVAQTTRITVVSLASDPADAVVGDGVLIRSSDTEDDGFVQCVRVTVNGTITGTKQTFKDVADVQIPGTVNLTTTSVYAGALSGTIAIAEVTPPRTKNVAATVTVEITATPPTTITPAYDLGAISCSVYATQASFNYRGFDSMSTRDGGVTLTYPRRAAGISASIQHYPGCYLVGTSATGTFTYNAGAQYSLSSGGSIVTETVLTSTETNSLTGTGATSAAGYTTTGVLQRKSRPVFSTLAGVTYYEVITWTV